MEHLLQENVPKLLPLWHDLSARDMVQLKCHKRFFQDKLPDFSGSGIDICFEEENVKYCLAKNTADEGNFQVHACSLPFFPPNKVSLKSDPCLKSMNSLNFELKKFCVTLDHLRRCAKKTGGELQKELLSSYKIAKIMKSKESNGKLKNFTVPDTILQLATDFPKCNQIPEANFDYLGGCLISSETTEGSCTLLHPVGKELNKLGLTPLTEIYDSDKTFQAVYSEMKTVKLGKGCIQKIRCAFPGHCIVQQGRFCQYVNFTDSSKIYTKKLFRTHGDFENIAASSYNPFEYISISKDGELQLHNVETGRTLWNNGDVKPVGHNTLNACDFGSHPKSILSLTNNSVTIYDLRLRRKGGSILFANHFSSFLEEKLLNLKSLAAYSPFQHLISSTNHLYVCDERYANKPVLMWSHLFKSFPLYCDVACYSSNDSSSDVVALLGSQESRELSLFAVRFPESQIQPISLNSPLLLSSPSDFTDSLRLHGNCVNDDLIERIMNPLIGVCAIPHSKKMGFTAFQLSSFGDVFYQDFHTNSPKDAEHTYRVGTGCILTPPDKILPHISKWTDFFSKNSKKTYYSRSNLVSVNVDVDDMLSNSSDISHFCDLCTSNVYSCDKEVISTTNCSSCGLDTMQVEKSLAAFNNIGLLSGPVIENSEVNDFETTSLSDFEDEYTKGILKPWTNADYVSSASPTWDYESDISRLSFDFSKSNFSASSAARNFSDIFTSQYSDNEASQRSFQDETMSEFPFPSQETHEDFVPPSQDIRPIIGETLRTPSRAKIQISQNTSFAGF